MAENLTPPNVDSGESLRKSDLSPDPIAQFQVWLNDAIVAKFIEPNAMTLATADIDGRPSARLVLLKDVDDRGFVFYTNFNSRKASELDANPNVALVFGWDKLGRQVRVEGTVEKTKDSESDEYFQSRQFGSKLGAWVSNQSSVLPNREILESDFERLSAEYADKKVPRPLHWGGYRVKPESIEFWQGQFNRLHDRFRYRRVNGNDWIIERLYP